MMNRITFFIVFLCFGVLTLFGCAPSYDTQEVVMDPAIENHKKLVVPVNGKIYFGAFPDLCGWEDCVAPERIAAFDQIAGKKTGFTYFSQNWGNGIIFPEKEISIIRALGKVPFVRLMPRLLDDDLKDQTFSLQKIIDGDFDADLRTWARAARADGEPLLVDFAVEPNGDWFVWSGVTNGGGETIDYGDPTYPDGPERWRDAYRHIIDLFRAEGVDSVTWFFHPNLTSHPDVSWNIPVMYYPGDDYIDWIGVSIYGSLKPTENYWVTFSALLFEHGQKIRTLSKTKPFALLEFGVTDWHKRGSKEMWLIDAFETIQTWESMPFVMIGYWHEDFQDADSTWSTLRVDSSSVVQERFRNLIKAEQFVSELQFEK
jgi:hypothetical protein